jgi:DNA-binding MarR family transcriptional regulator
MRMDDPDDRRSTLVGLSDAGVDYLTDLRERRSALLAMHLSELDDIDLSTIRRAVEILDSMDFE